MKDDQKERFEYALYSIICKAAEEFTEDSYMCHVVEYLTGYDDSDSLQLCEDLGINPLSTVDKFSSLNYWENRVKD